MIAGILLAGGKGTRIKSKDKNKCALPFLNKPLITYGVELLMETASPLVVVVGAFYQSIKQVLTKYPVVYAHQRKRMGTGHALKTGLKALVNYADVDLVLVGYGDHTMFYCKETVRNLVALHNKEKAAVSFITTIYDQPDDLAWGRVIRDDSGMIKAVIEQKDASEEQRKIKEINAGFYCYDYSFLLKYIGKMRKSSVSGEYYITDLTNIALEHHLKVTGLIVPFAGVGVGINKSSNLEESQKLYIQKTNNSDSINLS